MQKVTGSTPVISTKGSEKIRAFFMSFVVYLLYSSMLDQYYIGHTADIDDRLFRHTNSSSKSTKKTNDWKLVYTEVFQSKSEVGRRELKIKNKRSRKYIEWLLAQRGLERPAGLREGHPERFRGNLHQ